MKKLFVLLILLIFMGCGDTINLASKRIILTKVTYNDTISKYSLVVSANVFKCNEYIYADPNFAEKGDIIQSVNGIIKVVKKAKK